VQHLEIAITELNASNPISFMKYFHSQASQSRSVIIYLGLGALRLVNVLTSPPLLIPIRQDAGHDFAFEMPEEVCKPKPQAEVPQAWKRQKTICR